MVRSRLIIASSNLYKKLQQSNMQNIQLLKLFQNFGIYEAAANELFLQLGLWADVWVSCPSPSPVSVLSYADLPFSVHYINHTKKNLNTF